MANEEQNEEQEQHQGRAVENDEDEEPQNEQNEIQQDPVALPSSLESESDSDSESDSESESELESTRTESGSSKEKEKEAYYTRPGEFEDIPEDDNSAESNIKRFNRVLNSRRLRRAQEEEEEDYVHHEDLFDFPKDRENWREEDLKELWADAPLAMTKPGWDPAFADDEDWEIMKDEVKEGRDPPIAPFYLPYRKHYPAIPDNHYDISNPKAVIEELDRIEEFLRWVSYIFPDGSSYEGTVWDDLAHGKGVYVAEQGLVRYEGEWLQNNMEGHGVVEVDIPDIEPIPGSKLEAQMRAEGKIITRDYMTPEDREWLEMDIEDSVRLADGNYEIPFYENDEWIRQFGQKPEKGRYRYAGQWKHSRMHGCGVYEVNERPIFGRFYFGELVQEDPAGCDEETCTLHAGIAEVAAAKARMFINKPDGMVREERGPYGDPQHPYFYEEEDVWQAPGFINQFYEVPDYWKTYVHEVDQEREMWLNSFYKAPLRLPMAAELEYWWENDEPPEFVLLNKEPEPDPNDPSKLVYTEDPVILHTPTGRIINYIEDEEHGIRLFWQPILKEGEEVDPSKVQFLPLGFDEFYGRETVEKKESFWARVITSIENGTKPWFEKLEKWTEEQKKASEQRKKLLEQELELVEAELCLEEAIEDMEEELKEEEKEAKKKAEMGLQEEDLSVSSLPAEQEDKVTPQEAENEEEEEDEDEADDFGPSSFGSVADRSSTNNKGNGSRFSTLSFASSGFLSALPSMVEQSFSVWKKGRSTPKIHLPSSDHARHRVKSSDLVTFPGELPKNPRLRAKNHPDGKLQVKQRSRKFVATSLISSMYSKNRVKEHTTSISWRLPWLHETPETNSDIILSLHLPLRCLDSCTG